MPCLSRSMHITSGNNIALQSRNQPLLQYAPMMMLSLAYFWASSFVSRGTGMAPPLPAVEARPPATTALCCSWTTMCRKSSAFSASTASWYSCFNWAGFNSRKSSAAAAVERCEARWGEWCGVVVYPICCSRFRPLNYTTARVPHLQRPQTKHS